MQQSAPLVLLAHITLELGQLSQVSVECVVQAIFLHSLGPLPAPRVLLAPTHQQLWLSIAVFVQLAHTTQALGR